MWRTIALSMMILISVGMMLPLANPSAHGVRQGVSSRKKVKRHSRAWWKRYRARLKRKRAAAFAAHRKAPLMRVLPASNTRGGSFTATLPRIPAGWNSMPSTNNAELRFRTETGTGSVPGQASLAVVAQSRPTPMYLSPHEQRRLISGVEIADLRRIVIDKMLDSNGWVTNDFVREVAGYRVFVVTAQTPDDGRSPEKLWNFYFTEVDGRIYSLTTTSPFQSAARMAQEAERFITGLHLGSVQVQQKLNR
jgi:hypothetical protein